MSRKSWGGNAQRSAWGIISAILIVVLTGALTWSLVTRPETEVVVVAPPPEGLSLAERTGVDALMGILGRTSIQRTGTISIQGVPIDIDTVSSSDGKTGSGKVIAARVSGDIVLMSGITLVKGDRDFWTAIGAASVLTPDWVRVPEDFLENKLFLPVPDIQRVFSGPDTTISVDTIYAGESSAVLSSEVGLSHISLPGYEVDVTLAPRGRPLLPPTGGPDLPRVAVLERVGGSWRIAPGPQAEQGRETDSDSPTITTSTPTP